MEQLKRFEKIYIEQSALESEVAQRAYMFFPKEKIQIVTENFFQKGSLSPKEMEQSKKTLLLKEFKGSFF